MLHKVDRESFLTLYFMTNRTFLLMNLIHLIKRQQKVTLTPFPVGKSHDALLLKPNKSLTVRLFTDPLCSDSGCPESSCCKTSRWLRGQVGSRCKRTPGPYNLILFWGAPPSKLHRLPVPVFLHSIMRNRRQAGTANKVWMLNETHAAVPYIQFRASHRLIRLGFEAAG